MLLEKVLRSGISALKTPTSALDARLILDFVLKKNSLTLPLNYALNNAEIEAFESLIRRRISGEPVAYILGEKEFYGLEFIVSKDVLIPRPDSEIIVETVIKLAEKPCKILDLCTGSGALIISILANLSEGFEGVGIDISQKALKIAEMNRKKLASGKNLTFIEFDIFSLEFCPNADIVVSNPPYIPSCEIEKLQADVKDFEPKIALDGGMEGLDFYKQIALKCKLSKFVILEIGAGQGLDIRDIFNKEGYKFFQSFNDLAGIERCLVFTA